MKDIITGAFVIFVVIVLAGMTLMWIAPERVSFGGGNGGLTAAKCAVTFSTLASVGHQQSLTILAANETRAWASIQVANNATNTVALSFDEGAAATLNSGFALNATTSNSGAVVKEIAFGRNTDLPYTGVVTGISNFGTSTVKVTECIY